MRGELAKGGAIELLRELEQKRITGTLRFESRDASGELNLYGGEIAAEQTPREDALDAVDVLLELGAGHYEVRQRLPPLPVSKGDDYTRTGSLAVHVPADLMTYCEHAGLSGRLELRHEGRRAEAIYDAGELLAIQLDGEGATDLSEVFGWEQGRFRVELDPSVPLRLREEEALTTKLPAAPREGSPREDTRQFLRVLEMALVDVIDESERARSPTRTSPPLPPPPQARPRPAALPPPPKRRPDDQTVRLIYLSGDPPVVTSKDTSTRHVQRGNAEAVLTEARPERRAAHPHPEPEAMAKKKKQRTPTEKKARPESEPSDADVAGAEAAADAAESDAAESDAAESDAAASDAAESDAAESDAAESDAAASERMSEPPLPAPPAGAAAATGNPLTALGWAFGVLLLGLLILAVLARLPPVQ